MAAAQKDSLSVFASAVIEQGECIARGDHRGGNREAKKYVSAARTLLADGSPTIDRFCKLLDHDHDDVRVMAAAFLLKERTKEAVATLRQVARNDGLAALGAKMTLKRYARGELEIQ
jgi:hypothetical protein